MTVFKPYFFLVTPPLLWAGNMLVGRAVRDDILPLSLSFGRWVIALLVLLPFALPHIRRDLPRYRSQWPLIAATAVTGCAAFNTLVYTGLHSTTGTNAILLNSCIPVLILLFGALFYRQPLHGRQIAGLAVSLTGVALIILRADWQNLVRLQFNPGDLWVLAAVVCWALYTLWMKRIDPAVNRTGLTAVQIVIALAVLLPFWLWETARYGLPQPSPDALLALAYVGLLPSVAAYLCYNAAIAHFGPVRAGLSIHLMPVFGTLMAVGLLGETLYAYHLLGIGAIFAGILLSSRTAP
ncbi:DMT family transporter [Neisseria leonii]|uniref:DMT family transporter n=1 Tax=Neisseria leonii TaxID=2995413 RepID=UPI0030CE52B7